MYSLQLCQPFSANLLLTKTDRSNLVFSALCSVLTSDAEA